MMNLEMMMMREKDDDDGHEQDQKQDFMRDDHGARHRGLGQMKPYEPHSHQGDQGLRMKAHDHGSKQHPYFLRAKTTSPRFIGYQVRGDDGDLKKPSFMGGVGMDKERAVPSFLPSSRSRTDHFDELSEEEDLANCLVMLSSKSHAMCRDENQGREAVEKGMFQCKACKKVFNSHQALGGHRASHKKVKGCFASKIDDLNDDENIDAVEESMQEDQETQPLPSEPAYASTSTRKRTKMHECSVCRRVFSSGQALGGHKRCHWLTTSTDNAFIPNFHDFQYDHRSQQLCKKPVFPKPHEHEHEHDLDLNLNLPPTPHPKRDGDEDRDKTDKPEASTRLCLHQWSDPNQQKIAVDVTERNGDQEGCAMKLRKLSDLRDVNLDGGWLQMGIPSTSEMR